MVVEILELLLKFGANPNVFVKFRAKNLGCAALSLPFNSMMSNVLIVKSLLENGAKTDVIESDRISCLERSILSGNVCISEMLLEHGDVQHQVKIHMMCQY